MTTKFVSPAFNKALPLTNDYPELHQQLLAIILDIQAKSIEVSSVWNYGNINDNIRAIHEQIKKIDEEAKQRILDAIRIWFINRKEIPIDICCNFFKRVESNCNNLKWYGEYFPQSFEADFSRKEFEKALPTPLEQLAALAIGMTYTLTPTRNQLRIL